MRTRLFNSLTYHLVHTMIQHRDVFCWMIVSFFAIHADSNAHDSLEFSPRHPNGKRIVLIAGDEEYRSEESLPMLAKLLSQRHGFHCTVLFSWGPDGADYIDPNNQSGLRGLHALDGADLMVLATRFRRPSADQATSITRFLDAGKPVIGLRTATHAFAGTQKLGERISYEEFGLRILGETWVRHHGIHKVEGTRSRKVPAAADHPILQGVASFFAPSDVYGVIHLNDEDQVLLRAEVTASLDPKSPPVAGEKNTVPQPLAWLHEYTSPKGTKGTSFCVTSGASVDFLDANLRRLVVNAVYYLTRLEVPRRADVRFVDPYHPSFFGFIEEADYWKRAKITPASFELGKSLAMADPPGSPTWNSWPHRNVGNIRLHDGQRIALVGNSLAERMNLFGHLETRIHHRFVDQQLLIRNFGWPADEVGIQQRPDNYTTIDDPLEVFGPDLFLCCFGFNESFAGTDKATVDQFLKNYRGYIQDKVARFSRGGKSPRFVLVSPIAWESAHHRLQPDGQVENERLARYTSAVRQLATEDNHAFVDLFQRTDQAFSSEPGLQFTVNGIHLNAEGDHLVARLLETSLFGSSDIDDTQLERLRNAVIDKAWHHQQDYRMLNGWYVYGGRRTWDTETFPSEFRKIRNMVAVRDQFVWDIAAGRTVPDQPDDSQTGETVVPETMFGTRDDAFRQFREPKRLDYPTPAQSIAQMSLPERLEVKLFADESRFPALANPVQLEFDGNGRLWVACMANYPQWNPAGSKPNDRILILEDTDRDGQADRSTVFYDKLICPTGFEFWNGGILVVDQPRVLFLKDTDGDDRADYVVHLMDGFGSDDTHHAIGAWEYSPVGQLHMLEGISMSTTLETPWGPFREKGPSGAYVLDPLTWRVRHYRTPGHGNPWCLLFDRWGQGIIGDGTGAIQHWVSPLSGSAVPTRRTLQPIFDNEGIRPAVGSEFLASRHFPAEYQTHFIYGCVINLHGFPRFEIHDMPGGSGMEGKRIADLLASTDNFFRPVDPKIGPDGALWFGDWCNPLIGHMQYSQRDPNRDHDHGRIYRLVHRDRPLLPVMTHKDRSVSDLVRQLECFEPRTRYRVRRELRDRDSTMVLPAIDAWVGVSDDPQQLCEAMWVQAGFRELDAELWQRCMAHADYRVRAAAVQIMGDLHEQLPDALQRIGPAVRDEHPRVRLEAVRALSFLNSSAAAIKALEVTELPLDYWLEYTLDHTLLALAAPIEEDAQFLAKLDGTARKYYRDFQSRMTPGGQAAGPLAIAEDPQASDADRATAITQLANMDDGDIERGRVVFQRVCGSCHVVDGKGKEFGPELSSLARKSNREEIVRSIVWPNDTISAGYGTLVISTANGKSYSGVLVEEHEESLTMRVAEGVVVVLDKSSIEERLEKKASSMPEGLVRTIAPIEFLDLLAFLKTRDKATSTELRDGWIDSRDDAREPRLNNGHLEISQGARLQLEPNFPAMYNQAAAELLAAGDPKTQPYPDFVIHSPDRGIDQPFVIIALPQLSEVRSVWIENRRNPQFFDRANSLAIWVSVDGQIWDMVWRAAQAEREWDAVLPAGTTARYLKIGLRERGILHLHRVAAFGKVISTSAP